MILIELLKGSPVFEIHGQKHMQIEGIATRIDQVKNGDLYVYYRDDRKLPYEQTITKAKEKGAIAVCITRDEPVIEDLLEQGMTFIKTYHLQRFVSSITYNYYGNPSQCINLIGITGSHGKTTIAQMIESILVADNRSAIVFSDALGDVKDMENAMVMNKMIYKAGKKGISTGVLECSYTGIIKEFYRHVKFDSIIFSDLYTYFHNHEEDYHYFEVRKTLLDHLKRVKSPIIVNNDDYYTAQIKGSNTVTYGIYQVCDVNACNIELTETGCNFLLITPKGVEYVELSVSGLYNVYNALAATAWAYSQGVDLATIKQGLQNYRNELVKLNLHSTVDVLVENKLSRDRLDSIFETLKNLYSGKIATVFCVGDEKPVEQYFEYAETVKEYSDFCVLSSDFECARKGMIVANALSEKMGLDVIDYELDHNKALQKAVSKVDNKGEKNAVVVISSQGFYAKKITHRLTPKSV